MHETTRVHCKLDDRIAVSETVFVEGIIFTRRLAFHDHGEMEPAWIGWQGTQADARYGNTEIGIGDAVVLGESGEWEPSRLSVTVEESRTFVWFEAADEGVESFDLR